MFEDSFLGIIHVFGKCYFQKCHFGIVTSIEKLICLNFLQSYLLLLVLKMYYLLASLS